MRNFPVMNLGQPMDFINSACKAVDTYNDWDGWEDTPTGSAAQASAVSALQSLVNQIHPSARLPAIQQIREKCPNSAAILDLIIKPNTVSTPPLVPTGAPVASVDPLDFGPYTPPPPPPNTNPPVATGQPGPGRGAFAQRPDVESSDFPFHRPYTPPEPTGFTGSEPEAVPPYPTTPPPPPFTPPPPMVPTGGQGCWYTPGKGYSWGARPSGSETTGLNQSDCANLMRYDQEIRGQALNTPAEAPVQATQFNQQTSQATQYSQSPTPANMQPAIQTPRDVASTMCPPGQFWDGRQCRGSIAPGAAGLISAAGMGPSGANAASGVTSGVPAYSSGGAPGAFSMAGRRRYPVVNL